MKSQRFTISVSVLIVALVLGVGLSRAQGPGPQSPLTPQAEMGTAFTYQGQLESSGSLVTANCDFQFALYDAASGGT